MLSLKSPELLEQRISPNVYDLGPIQVLWYPPGNGGGIVIGVGTGGSGLGFSYGNQYHENGFFEYLYAHSK